MFFIRRLRIFLRLVLVLAGIFLVWKYSPVLARMFRQSFRFFENMLNNLKYMLRVH